jgi:hypothetical protein
MSDFNGLDFTKIDNYGCLFLIDEIPHLFLIEDDVLLDGIPIFSEKFIYTSLEPNEMLLVAVNIEDENGLLIDTYEIDEDNYGNMSYTIMPIKLHTLKTEGLEMFDLMDLDLLTIMVISLIDEYFEINL